MSLAAPARPSFLLEHVRSCLKHVGPTCSVCSPPQPNPGLPGFGHFKNCRKRASPQPAGEGVGVAPFFRSWRIKISPRSPRPSPPPQGGEGADRVCRRLLIPTSRGDPTGARKSARATSRPGVAAAVEEAVLVVVRGGLAGRLDGADLGERGLHRGALVDGVEPAR